MNSVLQPILATPYLNDYFANQFAKEKQLRSTRVAEAYYDLLKQCRNSGGSVVTPTSIKNAVSRTGGGASSFSGYG